MSLTKTSQGIVAGTAVVAGGLTAAVLIGTAAFISRHVTAETVSADTAAKEIQRQETRFAGQTRLREVRDGREPLAHPAGGARLRAGALLRALISDPRSRRLVRVDVPLAVLWVAEFEQDRIDLRLDQIDGHGPLLIVDHSHPSGARILMWVE